MPGSRADELQPQDSSSDWFSSDPAVYVQALDEFEQSLVQQGNQQQTGEEQELTVPGVQSPPTAHKRTHAEIASDYLDSDTYGAATYGGFGEYMTRKRAKLQIQNQTLTSESRSETTSNIFQGIAIYVCDNPASKL